MDAKEEKVIKDTVEELLKAFEIQSEVEVKASEETIEVLFSTNESGILIGYHGETLEALQLILSLLISKKIGRFIRVSLEVGDYRKNRSSFLENIALQAKERALTEQREITLPNLKSWERRIIHLFFQNDSEVASESIGEGKERTLMIKPK